MAIKKIATASGERTQGPFEVSQSVIKDWRRCEKKYDYKYKQLLSKKRPVVQLIRGTMVGNCLDLIAAHRSNQKVPNWKLVLAPYEKQYGRLFKEEQEYYGDPIGEVKRIVERYERLYANDGFTYLPGKDGNPFELQVKVDIAPGIVFTGHIDKMPRDKHGRVWDLDHKTAKNFPDAEARFADLQQVFYQWASPLSGYPKLTGVIWDYIRTKPPAIPEQLKNGELTKRQNIDTDYETYLGEIKRLKLKEKDYAPILRDLKARGSMDYYQRIALPAPNKDLVKQVVADATNSALEIRKRGGVNPVRSMDRTCSSCEFYSLCQAEFRGLDSDFIRKTEYQVQEEPRHDHSQEDNE